MTVVLSQQFNVVSSILGDSCYHLIYSILILILMLHVINAKGYKPNENVCMQHYFKNVITKDVYADIQTLVLHFSGSKRKHLQSFK